MRFHITLSTKNFDQALFHEILKNSCLESYKDASYFQITLKGFGSELWSMQGHICFRKDVKRRNARTRLREKFLASFKQLSLPSGEGKAFADMLDKNFTFVADDSVLSGETHSWKVEGENAPGFLPPTLAASVPPHAAGTSAAGGGALPALPVGPSIGGGQAAAASIA